MSFVTPAGGVIISNPGEGVTFDGYTYSSIVLGNGQEWMVENLRTTIYANGDLIPNVIDSTEWVNLSIGAWCHYNNDSQFENPYGKLYSWYSVGDVRNVCPTGWHVPSDTEWSSFINYLDPNANGGNNENIAGSKMKSTGNQYWQFLNEDATNESGFTGLPGGCRFNNYIEIGYYAWWWSSTGSSAPFIASGDPRANSGTDMDIVHGFSIRCLKD